MSTINFQEGVCYEEEVVPNKTFRGTLCFRGENAGHIVLEKGDSCSVGNIPAEYSEWYHLSDLFVAKEFRGRRYASFLTEKAIEIARREQTPILNEVDPYAGLLKEELERAFLRHGFQRLNQRFLYFNPKGTGGAA